MGFVVYHLFRLMLFQGEFSSLLRVCCCVRFMQQTSDTSGEFQGDREKWNKQLDGRESNVYVRTLKCGHLMGWEWQCDFWHMEIFFSYWIPTQMCDGDFMKTKKFVEFLIYLLSVGKRIDIQINLGEICDNCHQFSHSRIKSNSINRSALKISQIIWNCSEILSSPEINNFHLILCTLEVNKVSSPKLLKLATTLNRAIFQNKPSNLFAPAKWHHL